MARGTTTPNDAPGRAAGRRLPRQDLIALALLGAAVIAFYLPVVTGRAWLPAGGGDLVSFLYPMYRFIAGSLWDGQIPLWNPHQYAGTPLIADNQAGIFYPVNLILYLVNPSFGYGALQALVIGHVWLAGAAMFVCLRYFWPDASVPAGPALVGALVFMFSDVFVIHAGNLNLIAVAAWLPLTFLAYHRALLAPRRRDGLAWAVASGALFGVATLAGHGQMTFITASFLGSYAVYRLAAERDRRALPLLVLVGLIGAGMAAVSLLPAALLTPLTRRGDFGYAQAAAYALPPRGLVGLIAPGFYGRSTLAFWGDWPRVETGYAGILPLLLAPLALSLRPRRRRLFFGLAGIVFLLLALGPATPVHRLAFTLLPLPFQVPARWVLPLDFCLAWLAADGVAALYAGRAGDRRRWIAGAGVALLLALVWLAVQAARAPAARQDQAWQAVLIAAVFGAAGWLLLWRRLIGRLPAPRFLALAVALVATDLIALGAAVEIEPNRPTTGYERAAAINYLKGDPGIHRLDVATGLWQPSAAQLHGLYDVGGVFNPLQLANHAVYMGAVGFRGSPLYNLTGVKYIVADKLEPPGDTAFIVPVFNGDPDVDVYLNTRALPRVFLAYEAIVAPDADAAFAAVHAAGFDPAHQVVVEDGPAIAGGLGGGQVEITRYDRNRAVFTVSTDGPAYLVLSDVYHPDWRATRNGESVPIYSADYAFRAVFLPEGGRHVVAMRFAPRGWPTGAALSLVTMGLVGGWGIVWRRKIG